MFGRSISTFLLLAASAAAQIIPANQRVLVVYNAASPDSLDVAKYYLSVRGIPESNLCAIRPPSTSVLNQADYEATVRGPVADCLNAIGPRNILYIVLSYQTPYRIDGATGLTYSLDSYLADIFHPEYSWPYPESSNPYLGMAQSEGGAYDPFVRFADFRSPDSAPLIYSVWRLDAPTAAFAKGLADKAVRAESAALSGNACISAESAAAAIARRASLPIDSEGRCDDAIFFAGTPAYRFGDLFVWKPGAVGIATGSSADWAVQAMTRGITVAAGSIADPLDSSLRDDGILRNLFQGASVGDALLRNTPWLRWTSVYYGDPLYRPFPNGRAPFNAPVSDDSLALVPQQVVGGTPAKGVVTLSTPAPSGGRSLPLSYDAAAPVSAPASVTVDAGASTTTFVISTSEVTAPAQVTIAAHKTNTLTILPWLATLAISPGTIAPGTAATAKVVLNGPAPAGGLTVALAADNTDVAAVPPAITIPEGAVSGTFQIAAASLTGVAAANVSASYHDVVVTAPVNVVDPLASVLLSVPEISAGTPVAFRVNLSVPAPAGGALIALSTSDGNAATVPATMLIPAGATTGSATVATTESAGPRTVTVTATYLGASMSADLSITPDALDSLSLSPSSVAGGVATTANVVKLQGAAPPTGAAVQLTSSDPSVIVPATVIVPSGAIVSPAFSIQTSPVADATRITITAAYLGVTKTEILTLLPPQLAGFNVSLSRVAGGTTVTAHVTLSTAAPAGGAVVTLTSSDVSASVPASVTVPAGATTFTFNIQTAFVTATAVARISATYGGVSQVGDLTIDPTTLETIKISQTSVTGGQSFGSNQVVLSGPAPPSGAVVTLTSLDPAVTVPASVTVPGGSTTAFFTIQTSSVSEQKSVTVQGSFNGVVRTATLTVAALQLLSFSPDTITVIGGEPAIFGIALTAPSPPGGVLINITTTDPAYAPVSANLLTTGGLAGPYGLTVFTVPTLRPVTATITASFGGVTKSVIVNVQPSALSGLTVGPSIVTGGLSATGRVTINGKAPAGGLAVKLESADPSVTVQDNVYIPGGNTSATFLITTTRVTEAKTVAIKATYNGSKSVNLRLNP